MPAAYRPQRSLRMMAVLLSGAICITACTTTSSATSVAKASPESNPFRIGRPLVIPHAGGDALFPEDTLYAYEHSIAMGGDVVDADVQLTADAIPIAFHDGTLDRTTNGTGKVEDKTYSELAGLDAAFHFERDGSYPYRGLGISIPTIESLLETFPHTLVTLDLKDLRTAAVRPLCMVLKEQHRTRDVYIGVDTAEQVALFRTMCPEVHTSGTDAERQAMRAARAAQDPTFVTTQLVSQPEFVSSDGTKRITPDYLAFSHSKDIAVLTWVVDNPADMEALTKMGVDGIYTRRPDVMVKLLKTLGLE